MGRTLNRVTAACVSLASLALSAWAQSGRNTERPDAAPPAAAEAPAGFSESVPLAHPEPAAPAAAGKSAKKRTRNNKNIDVEGSGAGDVIKVETNLVSVPVSVFDRNGMYVKDLGRSDFKVFEDGVEQEIAYFGTTEKPFTVVLLLDTSLSTNYKIEEIRRAAIAFVDQLRPQDAVAVIEFDGNVNVLTNATSDRTRLYKAINKADFGYGTSLYDAVYYSLQKKLSKVTGRKAIVLFTDGVDTTSKKAGFDTTLSLAEESDAVVFPVYFNTFAWDRQAAASRSSLITTSGTTAEEYALGRKYLVNLASYTGGRVFQPEAAPGGLNAAFEGIAEELRRQYNIGYIPQNTGTVGQRKQIRVRIDRPNLIVRSRDSYIVGGATASSNSLP